MRVNGLSIQRHLLTFVLVGLAPWIPACDHPAGIGPPNTPPPVRFVPIASFEGSLSSGIPAWSPVAQTLVFNGSDGLMAYDTERPGSAPRLVVQEYFVVSAAWSPDGTWLSFKVAGGVFFVSPIFAVALSGGEPVMLVERGIAGSHVWAANGKLYYWEKGTAERQRLAPPRSWKDARPRAAPDFHLVSVAEPQARDAPLHVFSSIPVEREWILTGFEPESTDWIIGEDVFPHGLRFLLSLHDDASGVYSLIVDSAGNKLVEFDGSADLVFYRPASSISSGGAYVVGVDIVGDEFGIVSSKLRLRNASGNWSAPIEGAPDGLLPQLSSHGLLLAFQGLFDRRVHVGRLEIGPERKGF